MKKILLFLGLILSINSFSQDTLSLEYVTNYVNKKMEGKVPGLAVSIVTKDSILWSKGFGYADIKMEKPFTNNTIIGIASISKVILGLAISTAQDEGLLDINEDINKYLPFKVINPYHTEKDIITMSHLMTHTSTIIERDRIYCKGDFLGKDSPIELGDFLKDYLSVDGKYYKSKNFHDKKPGTIHDYSNIGAGLAAYIIEVTSGMPYNEYCKKYIFIPLQMENTGFLLSDVDLNNHAKHYKKYGKPFPYPTLTTYPDGGLRTSVNELSYFLLATINSGNIANENVIDSAIVNRTIKPQFKSDNRPVWFTKKERYDIGYFWSLVFDKGELENINFDGSDYGVSTDLKYNYKQDVGVIMFVNIKYKGCWDDYKDLYELFWSYGLELKYK